MTSPQLTPVFAGTAFTNDGASREVALDLATPSCLRLRVSRGASLGTDVSYAIAKAEFPKVDAQVTEEDGLTTIKTGALTVTLRDESFSLQVKDQYGFVRYETAEKALFHTEGEPRKANEDPDHLGGLGLRRLMPAAERVYGLAETGESLDKAGRRYALWNTDDPVHRPDQHFYCQIPFSIHLTPDANPPHAAFLDNPGFTVLDFGYEKEGEAIWRAGTGDLVLWLLFEDSPKELLRAWTDLTGRINRPPMWALGYHQCRWSYNPDERFRELAREFRTRKIPCDCLYFDIDYMYGFRVFTWDPVQFSQPYKLLAELKDQGFHTVAIVDPGVKIDPDYQVYKDFLERDGFFLTRTGETEPYVGEVWPGEVHFPDFTNPEVRRRWGAYQGTTLLDPGVDGIWNDMNEPSCWNDPRKTLPLDATHHDFGVGRSHEEIHQIYGMAMAQASCEGIEAERPDARPFVITRSGWAGVQRYAMLWTGDNVSQWYSMPLDVMTNLSMGMTGIPFTGCDIGGFGNDADREMFARWMEWGVFQPFCRAHSAMGTRDQEPWAFGPGVERIARKMIEIRMRLLPAIYTAFVEASETGAPINRPLVYEFPEDATLHRIGDQWMLGSDLLVAPVLTPGAERRPVYLPAGEWVDFWNGERHHGARWILAEAAIGHVPVYVRAGAVVPMAPVRQHTGEPCPETYLDIYPGAKLSGRLVEDDGATRAYERGEEARYAFTGEETAEALRLTIPAPQGPYRSGRELWVFRLHRQDRPVAGVTANGENVAFSAEGPSIRWTVPDTREVLAIEVRYGA
ncbi:MAG: glycoside hydrolase family 31 protein [Sumerlaeia bacterium]